MLIDFSYSNFKSFRDEQRFSMELAYPDEKTDERSHPEISTIAAVYGGNAAGKTGFVDALGYVSSFVRSSFATAAEQPGTGRDPYRLEPLMRSEPSSFLVYFYAEDGLRYEYEFSVDDDRVLYERLRKWRESRPSKVFERRLVSAAGEEARQQGTEIAFGRDFKGSKSLYTKALKENALLLSVIASSGDKQVEAPYNFLAKAILPYDARGYSSELGRIARTAQDNPLRAEAFDKVVQAMDLGLEAVRLNNDKFQRMLGLLGDQRDGERIRTLLNAALGMRDDAPEGEERSRLVDEAMRFGLQEKALPVEPVFLHAGADGPQPFEEGDESDGTLATLSFLSMAIRSLSAHTVTVVDEIDTSLHPAVVRQLVGLYKNPRTNPFESQLIFTTHDVSLLMRAVDGDSMLKRGQIWLVEKSGGASSIYPITQYGVRRDENIARNYLNGVYGGVPAPELEDAFADALELAIAQSTAKTEG